MWWIIHCCIQRLFPCNPQLFFLSLPFLCIKLPLSKWLSKINMTRHFPFSGELWYCNQIALLRYCFDLLAACKDSTDVFQLILRWNSFQCCDVWHFSFQPHQPPVCSDVWTELNWFELRVFGLISCILFFSSSLAAALSNLTPPLCL